MIDLHVHTIYSDGEYTPKQILDKCKQRGITTVAITDHNAMEGSKRALFENDYPDITVISGVELSAVYPVRGANLHILGYNFNLQDKCLNDVTNSIMQDNVARLKSLVDLFVKHYNFSFRDEDLEKVYASVGNIGKPDIARLCVSYGYAKTVREVFDNYINPIEDKMKKRSTLLTDRDCIDYIKNAGGIACLAHPIELKKSIAELKTYIKTLMSYGLEAVEVYQSKHSKKYSQQLLEFVNEFGLVYSVGSDYHGPLVSPDADLGFGNNHNLQIETASILSRF